MTTTITKNQIGEALYVVNKEAKKERDANQALFGEFVDGDDKIGVLVRETAWEKVLEDGTIYHEALSYACRLYSEYYVGAGAFDSVEDAVSAYMTFIAEDIVDFEGCWEWSDSELEDAVQDYIDEKVQEIKDGFFAQLKASKARRQALYALKSEVVKSEGTYVATHTFADDDRDGILFDLYEIGCFSFHQPVNINTAKGVPTKAIHGTISADAVATTMDIDTALSILSDLGYSL